MVPMTKMLTDEDLFRSGMEEASQGKIKKLGRRTSGTGLRGSMIPSAYSFLLVSLVMAVTLSALIQPLHANPTCILNCAQCVKIYGDYFDGHSCARVCMESRSRFDSFVDCADPTTIARFLKSY